MASNAEMFPFDDAIIDIKDATASAAIALTYFFRLGIFLYQHQMYPEIAITWYFFAEDVPPYIVE